MLPRFSHHRSPLLNHAVPVNPRHGLRCTADTPTCGKPPVVINLNFAYSQECACTNSYCSCLGGASRWHHIDLLWDKLSQLVDLGFCFLQLPGIARHWHQCQINPSEGPMPTQNEGPFWPPSPPPLRSRPPYIQLAGLGSAVSSPAGSGLGQSPSGNRIWCILVLKSGICWHQFYYFSWVSIDHSVCIFFKSHKKMFSLRIFLAISFSITPSLIHWCCQQKWCHTTNCNHNVM